MSTITTLTLNPSFDRTLSVAALERGQVHRLESSLVEPGGKGINIARSVAINGGTARAVFPADDEAGAAFAKALVYPGLTCHPVLGSSRLARTSRSSKPTARRPS